MQTGLDRSANWKLKDFFIKMGRRSRYLLIPAVFGLTVSVFLHHFFIYCRRGSRRFVCTAFLIFCFVVESSFAYPASCMKSGSDTDIIKETEVTETIDLEMTMDGGQKVEIEKLPRQEGEPEDAEHAGMNRADKYSLDEILNKEQGTHPAGAGRNKAASQAESADVFDAEDWKIVLVNKQHPIPDNYAFTLGTIKTIKGNMQCDERIVEELLSMMQDAGDAGVNLAICSPYRDLQRQEVLFNRKIKSYMNKGLSYMEAYKISSQTVTVPGASEHQIGLAIDIVSDTYTTLNAGFADTDAGIWLEQHCAEYGFILRYPEGKEFITGIEYEPWHFRYVGKEAAELIMKEEICLEEFWEKYVIS